MDYLRKLPNELWREIFLHVSNDFLYASRLVPENIAPFRRLYIRHSLLQQFYRLRLSGICKYLQPLAEEMLYTEVILSDTSRFNAFIASACIRIDGRKSHGEWTKSVVAAFEWSVKLIKIDLSQIMVACPNHQYMEVYGEEVGAQEVGAEAPHWKRGFQTLRWNATILWADDLFNVASHSPDLTQLGLYTCDLLERSITFPSVEHLALGPRCYFGNDVTKFQFPSLNSLKLDLFTEHAWEQMEPFLQREGPKLRSLEILSSDYDSVIRIGDLFDTCSQLRTLIIDPDRCDIHPQLNGVVHKHLETVVFVITSIPDDESLAAFVDSDELKQEETGQEESGEGEEESDEEEEDSDIDEGVVYSDEEEERENSSLKKYAADFTRQYFPQLRTITVVVEYAEEEEDLNIFSKWVSKLFPYALVDVTDRL